MEHILNLEQVKKYYGGNSGNITKAVDGISMYVDKGEFVAIMGASGSGKTTLLNCISTIDTVTSGHITVNNQDITKIKDKDFADFRRENLGFIFQDFNLLDTLLLLETMSDINKKMQATILMVTHDPFSASFCERILFLKDGKIFNEIFRGEKSRKDFFNEILDILTLLGGEVGNVR